jgi:hypothetical protein
MDVEMRCAMTNLAKESPGKLVAKEERQGGLLETICK